RQVIFQDDEDCKKYLQCIAQCKTISGFTLHAYCLMGNHIHLLIEVKVEDLDQIFKRIGVRYAYWYNWKYMRSGHLFQDRFKSEPINDDASFIAVLRYIYQNPVKAGLCKNPEDYIWSSYNKQGAYLPLTDCNKALELLSEAEFRAFLAQSNEEQFLDIEADTRLNDREAASMIKVVCNVESLSDFHHLPAEQQTTFILELHKKRCSIRQLVRLVGISKGHIERILRN
ncbi:MAG: transposase, partial [Anaerovorax sp.]